ncbi:hypothetical protein GWR30_22960 [Salmonella enterica]|nr:hypothetical protein [Salmonella enterica]
MKDKFIIPPARIVVGFYQLRSQYAERELESLHRMYNESCILCDKGDYHDALLCFCFIKNKIGDVISSADSSLASDLSHMLMNANFCISECMDKLLHARGDNHVND